MLSDAKAASAIDKTGTRAIPVIAITPGEPAGIGPDLAVLLAQTPCDYIRVYIGDPHLLEARAKILGVPFTAVDYSKASAKSLAQGEAFVYPVYLSTPSLPGELQAQNAAYVLKTLDVAIEGCLSKAFSALVTGPVHKGVINESGVMFSGHTEYLQEKCNVEKVVMMLANRHMRVALATTHLPLKDVAAAISKESLTQVISILIADMQSKFSIERPRILVAGLNPHAGEGGHIGREEIDVVEPVLESFRGDKTVDAELIGPLPADTLFTPKYLEEADAVLSMFHDQGLPVLKYAGFGESVNITLGLPMIRTSVDHGTALDLAGTGNIDLGSMQTALSIAVDMCASQQQKSNR